MLGLENNYKEARSRDCNLITQVRIGKDDLELRIKKKKFGSWEVINVLSFGDIVDFDIRAPTRPLPKVTSPPKGRQVLNDNCKRGRNSLSPENSRNDAKKIRNSNDESVDDPNDDEQTSKPKDSEAINPADSNTTQDNS